MRPPTSLKKEFLKKWIMGLQLCSSSKKEMSFLERKKAIKLSADVAMASARNATTRWSRALISNASKDDSNKGLVECILEDFEKELQYSQSKEKLISNGYGQLYCKEAGEEKNTSAEESCTWWGIHE
ncbi:unnamed protein product, partial [Vitis vinifera]